MTTTKESFNKIMARYQNIERQKYRWTN